MIAAEKMMAFGMKEVADAVGKDLSVVYRWRKALLEGRGIRDANKRALIKATAESANKIGWADFAPASELAA